MQAHRAAATVNEEGELRIAQVPFPPGAVLDVILLEQEGSRPRAAQAVVLAAAPDAKKATGPSDKRRPEVVKRIEEQYRIAQQYPGEYVVLVGDRVVFHAPARQEVFRAYKQAFVDFPQQAPVVVEPGGKPRKPPVLRGRTLTKARTR
jgi:hypothetical protein